MGNRILMLASVSALLLALPSRPAHAAPAQQSGSPRERCAAPIVAPHVGRPDLLPLLDVADGGRAEDPSPPIGGYVQLWVEAAVPDDDTVARCYDSETRSWVNRLFVGRNLSRVLQAKVSVTSPGVIGSVTLASSTRTSTRSDGEVWNTDLSARRILTPHFRVDPGTTISVDVTLSASSTINGDITRNILSVIEQGARLASPTSSLVTTLTSDRLQNAANFVDRSISNLFGQKLSERSQQDSRPGQWFGENRGVLATVSAAFPMGNDVWDASRNRPLGSWTIRVSEPLISVFSTVPFAPPRGDQAAAPCANADPQERQACRAFIGLSAGTVLNFRLTDNVTLGDALRGDEAISTELSRLQGNTREAETARRLCSLVASKAEALGLNRYDAAAALWAFAYETQIAPDGRLNLLRAAAEGNSPASCKAAILATSLKLL